MKKKMKKKVFSLALVILCMAVLTVSGTLAYFTADDTATNVITTNKIDIDLVEMTVDPEEGEVEFPIEGIHGVMPGQSVSKIVRVTNDTLARPAWVRINVESSIVLADGTAGDTAYIEINFDTNNWEQGTDGWYYYKKELAAGKTTEALFDVVQFKAEMPNPYQECQTTIVVTAQAVQTANNGTSALTAQGWPQINEEV